MTPDAAALIRDGLALEVDERVERQVTGLLDRHAVAGLSQVAEGEAAVGGGGGGDGGSGRGGRLVVDAGERRKLARGLARAA